ncbi:hypothetical protein [Pseudodesulfovibrio pelocollis]|uniref:hypothetical protein n=1 Tax=Pseudodesulfovibrio pelocollis TaxID=3051432 RepID=UPI00255B3D9B|nr:hypothetical protein [Pseudodesulfovibrio sp. SB368]
MKEAPCHFVRPFLDRFGDLYPCCFVNMKPEFKIGSVDDEDLLDKMYSYDKACQCGFLKFRKWQKGDKLNLLNIQTSLSCHGKCAVCYVSAPLKKENIELDYEKAYNFLEKLNPNVLYYEGGEVPIQKKALEFVAQVKKGIAPQKLHLLTNGCYNTNTAKTLSDMFTDFTVSYMGISKNTYYHETMLDVDVTKNFSVEVHRRTGKIGFRYICTPLTMIEAGDFLDFAAGFKDSHVIYADCDINSYAKEPRAIPYWSQVIRRCQLRFKESLLTNREKLLQFNFKVKFEPRTAGLLGVSKELVDKFKIPNVDFY